MYCSTVCSKNIECRSMFLNYLLINGEKCGFFFIARNDVKVKMTFDPLH